MIGSKVLLMNKDTRARVILLQQGTTTIVFALATTAISTIAAYYLKSAVVLEQELEFSASGLKSFVVATLTKVETYIAISCYVAALFLVKQSVSPNLQCQLICQCFWPKRCCYGLDWCDFF